MNLYLRRSLEKLRLADKSFPEEAYIFVLECIQATAGNNKSDLSADRLPSLLQLQLLELYGPLANAVMKQWGLTNCQKLSQLLQLMQTFQVLQLDDKELQELSKGGSLLVKDKDFQQNNGDSTAPITLLSKKPLNF